MKYAKTAAALKAFFLGFAIVFCLVIQAGSSFAQPARIKHAITRIQKDPNQSLGRDLWFTMAQNYQNQGGKYYNLYVTSPNNTTIFIAVTGGSVSKWPITAGQVVTFTVPLGWEVTTSGVVEAKGIRVWSNDADLTAYLLSRNPATSDGMLIIPTVGWGTEYVVAAYGSLFEGYGNFVYDFPSEFSIVANQNNTICTITPSVDLRCENGLTLVHKAHVKFTEYLNRGECVQYQAVLAQNCDDYDVTGSVVTSNNPVGIVGASQCPNIPCENQYCDHVCDMIPPIRTWANTYQTIPFDTRVAGDTYLVIGSKDGQNIYRNDPGNHTSLYCTLDKKYNYYFRPDVQGASIWSSDAPFLLVQYINSTTYEAQNGGSNAGKGDPAMVVVNAVEQYTPDVIFQTPNISGAGGFSNYANVMVFNDSNTVTNTLFDGVPINSAKGSTRYIIPNSKYIGFRVAQVPPGKHTLSSPKGVGVYVYGYGSYDSYAWAGSLGIKTFNDPDTIPPVAVPTGVCFDAHVTMADNHIAPPASKISEMKIDSSYNMSYTPDPNYQIGIAADQTYYDMSVIDITKPAYLKIETHDYAGNRTNVISTYIPQSATLTPAVTNYGSGNVAVKTFQYITFTNTGTIPYDWQSLKLLLGNQGFTIDSGLGSPTPIPVGGKIVIKVGFTPLDPKLRSDTLFLSDGCTTMQVIVIGTGGQPDFTVSNEDFECQLVGSTTKMSDATIVNLSKSPIHIDQITLNSTANFGFDPTTPVTNKLPITIAGNGQQKIEFSFTPNVKGPFQTTANFHSVEIGWKTATLSGSGCAPHAHVDQDTLKVSDCGTGVPYLFTITSDGDAEAIIDTVIIQGNSGFDFPPGNTRFVDQNYRPISLPYPLPKKGDHFYVNVVYTPPQTPTSGVFSAKVFAITSGGDTTNSRTATVIDVYRQLDPKKSLAVIPVVAYGSPVQNDVLTYCNNMSDTVTLQAVIPLQGKYNSSFKVSGYSVNGVTKNLPILLAQGDCVDINVQFDPSVSPDAAQFQRYSITSNSCLDTNVATVQSGTSTGPPTILGADFKPTILSCDTKDLPVVVTNPNFAGVPPMTIKNVTVTGANPVNFIPGTPSSNSLGGGKSVQIPVTFAPTAAPGPVVTNYTANVEVTLTSAAGVDTTLTAQVLGSSNGMSAVVNSTFAVQKGTADGQTALPLPINITFTKNGLTDPIDTFGITRITLTYTYNTDLLDLIITPNGCPVATGLPTGWSVNCQASNVNNKTGVLTLVLDGTSPLTDAQASGTLGQISFEPRLTKSGVKATSVDLAPPSFLTAAGTPVGNCLAITQSGTQFTLVYECGDSSLAYFLTNGKAPSMIKPVNPNPVSASNGGVVKFEYVTRHEGVVSIIIYDELGKEVKRVVNNQFHPSGSFEVQTDVSRLSSGSYIYRFQLDNGRAISGRLVVNN